MGANNFVQDLSNGDYVDFAKKILHLHNEYKVARINEETDYVRVELVRWKNKIIIDFRDFDYTIKINNKSYKEDIKTQTEWRKFMAKRFGIAYITAYKSFVDEYMKEMRENDRL